MVIKNIDHLFYSQGPLTGSSGAGLWDSNSCQNWDYFVYRFRTLCSGIFILFVYFRFHFYFILFYFYFRFYFVLFYFYFILKFKKKVFWF